MLEKYSSAVMGSADGEALPELLPLAVSSAVPLADTAAAPAAIKGESSLLWGVAD